MADSPWIEWHGGECPVEPETIVRIRLRDGQESLNSTARFWADGPQDWWKHQGHDIIAYRVVEPSK